MLSPNTLQLPRWLSLSSYKRFLIIGIVVPILASCAEFAEQSAPPQGVATQSESNVVDASVTSTAEEVVEETSGTIITSGTETVALNQVPQPRAKKPAPIILTQPDDLVGLGRVKLFERLGTPHFDRLYDHVEIVQYRLQHCVIDFVIIGDQPIVQSWHGRHRVYGNAYDHELCVQNLSAQAAS